MSRNKRPKDPPANLTRREFIGLAMGGMGAVLTCICGGAVGTYLVTRRRDPILSAPTPFALTSEASRYNLQKVIDKPVIVPRADWGALLPDHQAENENGFFVSETNPEGWRIYEGDLRATYKTLVVHHSVNDEGDDISTLLDIQRLHREDRGWADVAYHFFVGKTGIVYEGRALDVRGTHVAGYNTGSVGVCLLGNYMIQTPSEEQLAAAGRLSAWLAVRLQLTHMAGHREFNSVTVCPGDNVQVHLSDLAALAGLQVGIQGYNGPIPTEEATETSFAPCTCHL